MVAGRPRKSWASPPWAGMRGRRRRSLSWWSAAAAAARCAPAAGRAASRGARCSWAHRAAVGPRCRRHSHRNTCGLRRQIRTCTRGPLETCWSAAAPCRSAEPPGRAFRASWRSWHSIPGTPAAWAGSPRCGWTGPCSGAPAPSCSRSTGCASSDTLLRPGRK